MTITVFSFVVAILWCNVYVIIIALMRKRDNFLIHYSYVPLLFLVTAGVFRIIYSGEFPYTIVVHSEVILPAIYDFFTASLFTTGEGGSLHVYHVIVAVWVIGSVIFLLNIAHGQALLYKKLKTAPQVNDARIVSIMEEVVRESGKNIKVKIVQPEKNTAPSITGFFKPTVLMADVPFSDEELKLVLQHEWAHFLHKDLWTKLFMSIILAIFWWNPFVYVLRYDLDHILEVKCDLNVISKLGEKSRAQYLNSIVKVTDKMIESRSNTIYASFIGVIGTSSLSKIGQRFWLVLNYEQGKRRRVVSNALICGVIAICFAISYLFVVQPAYSWKDMPDSEGAYMITQEDSYLMRNTDGTYALYVNGYYVGDINEIVDELLLLPII